MSVYVTEFRGYAQNQPQVPVLPALATYIMGAASGSTAASTATLGANTKVISVSADSGALLLLTSSTSSVLPSSTSGLRVPAGVAPQFFAVPAGSRLVVMST